MSLVRAARPEDEASLFDLLTALRDNNNSFGFQTDDARIGKHIQMGTRGEGGLHGVIDAPDQPGVLAGSIGMVWDRLWFSSEFGLAVLWLFIREQYRGGTRFSDQLVDWAKERRAEIQEAAGQRVFLIDAVLSEQRLEAKLRLWRRHGGKLIGGVFLIS